MEPWMLKLKDRCAASIDESFASLKELGGEVIGKSGYQHGFLDRGAKVLVVAHLDYKNTEVFHFEKISPQKDTMIFCPRLDDRLGVFAALDVLPEMGIVTDVLLTENEERGKSTAWDFKPGKQYNWIAEFDRNGTDYVVYQFYKFNEVLRKTFGAPGIGSYSDISELGRLKALAFNLGVGYYDEHHYEHFFSVRDFTSQMIMFKEFFEEHKDIAYPYEPYVATTPVKKKKKRNRQRGNRKSRKENRYRKDYGPPVGSLGSFDGPYVHRLGQSLRDTGFKTILHNIADKDNEKAKSSYDLLIFNVGKMTINEAWTEVIKLMDKVNEEMKKEQEEQEEKDKAKEKALEEKAAQCKKVIQKIKKKKKKEKEHPVSLSEFETKKKKEKATKIIPRTQETTLIGVAPNVKMIKTKNKTIVHAKKKMILNKKGKVIASVDFSRKDPISPRLRQIIDETLEKNIEDHEPPKKPRTAKELLEGVIKRQKEKAAKKRPIGFGLPLRTRVGLTPTPEPEASLLRFQYGRQDLDERPKGTNGTSK